MDYKVSVLFRRSERWSILPELTVKGYISHVIF